MREADVRYEVLGPDAAVQVLIDMPPVEYSEPFVEIVHGDGEVVTVIEVLSPANKTPGEGRRQYLRRQKQLLVSVLHLVEIDLLAAKLQTLFVTRRDLFAGPQVPLHRYLVSTRRGIEPDRFDTYPILLPNRLPRRRVPLIAPNPDVMLDLQAAFERCYDNDGYADQVDYTQPPRVAVPAEEAAWLAEMLREKGLRA